MDATNSGDNMDAANSGDNMDTASQNLLTVSDLCQFYNSSQLYYYCVAHDHIQLSGLLMTTNDLNTIKISENLCGNYENHQGM